MALSDLAVERIEEAKELSRAGIDLTCIAFEQYFTPDDWRSGYWDPVGEASVPALALATPPATTVGIRVYTSNLVPELLAANHRVGPWGIGADERLVDKMLSPSWRGNLTRQ